MREIRFRAWDKDNKVMRADDLYPKAEREWYQWEQSLDVMLNVVQMDFILMQYTGLKDKHGVEIYEGDLFQDDEDGTVNWVEYDVEYAGFTTNLWWDSIDLAKHAKDYVVIGNIYENPELLEKETP